MPFGLAIETSGRVGSIAAVENGLVGEELQFPHGLRHAAQVVALIDRLCTDRGSGADNIDHLYVSAGPGSFTGLRIAITLAKTLAFSTAAKLVAVPTVEVLVRNAPPEAQHVIIVLDAKRGQIFTARFERRGTDWVEREPAHLDRLADMLARAPRPVHLLGEGLPYHQQHVPADDAGVIATAPDSWRARAMVVAELGVGMAAAGAFADPDTLTPIYIRLPEAEEKWLASQGRG